MLRFALAVGVSLILVPAAGMGVAPSPSSISMTDPSDADMTKVKAWVQDKLVPFVQGNKKLAGELEAANKDRAAWTAFSEDYKAWTPDDAEKNKTSYAYPEYVWSVKKDKDF